MIWRRYLVKKFTLSLLFFLFALFAIFVSLDLSTKGGKLLGKTSFCNTSIYYLYQFSSLLHFFLPLSFTLAAIQVLLDLQTHRELIALQMGGLSKKALLSPLYRISVFLFLLSLANQEWLVTKAYLFEKNYTALYAKHKKPALQNRMHSLTLANGSSVVFQYFQPDTEELFDLFWIKDPHTLWYMKSLHLPTSKASFVDQFIFNGSFWEKQNRFQEHVFPEISLTRKEVEQPFLPYEHKSLSQLLRIVGSVHQLPAMSHLFYKLFFSLIPLFSLSLIGTVCFSYSRQINSYKIMACSLLFLFSLMMLLDALLILGENQAINPYIAFGSLAAIIWKVAPKIGRFS